MQRGATPGSGTGAARFFSAGMTSTRTSDISTRPSDRISDNPDRFALQQRRRHDADHGMASVPIAATAAG